MHTLGICYAKGWGNGKECVHPLTMPYLSPFAQQLSFVDRGV
jgi:hypothetical protein